jgi:replicative DNA helicase
LSTGLGILHCILNERQDLSILRDAGIDETFFHGDEKKIYQFIESHFLKHNALPQIDTVETETEITFPQFPEEPIGYWIDILQRRHKTNLIADANKELKAIALSGDVDSAKDVVRKLLIDLEHGEKSTRIVTVASVSPDVMEAHNQRQKATSIKGVPFGLEYLDLISDGAQNGDTVALVGRPSTGKSFFLLSMADASYQAGGIPLLVTLEMSPLQCVRRILGMRARISVTRIRLGRLSFWSKRKLAREIAKLQDQDRPFHILQGRLDTTVEDLFVRVKELRPTVLYVDGAYLLRSRSRSVSRWERVAETAEFLKIIASEFNIPVIATYQFSRKGTGLGDIAYSDAVGQLASIAIGLEDFKLTNMGDGDAGIGFTSTQQQYKKLTLLKGREGERGVIKVLYDMEHSVISQAEVIKRYEEEESNEEVQNDE